MPAAPSQAAAAHVRALRDELPRGLDPEPVVYWVEWRLNMPRLERLDVPATWRVSPLASDWQSRIELDAIPFHTGGVRWYFRCVSCVKPCLTVYAPRTRDPFYCRACHRLSYASQQPRVEYTYAQRFTEPWLG